MNLLTIPLVNTNSTFNIKLKSGNYIFQIIWRGSNWVLDIFSAKNKTPLVTGIALVTGPNLLEQFSYLGIIPSLYITSNSKNDPDHNGLGTNYILQIQEYV